LTADELDGAYASVLLRAALGFSFLSAVADRFGWCGAYDQPHVAWGDFSRFVVYTGRLNWFVRRSVSPRIGAVGGLSQTEEQFMTKEVTWLGRTAALEVIFEVAG
jgi:hypothetical protein